MEVRGIGNVQTVMPQKHHSPSRGRSPKLNLFLTPQEKVALGYPDPTVFQPRKYKWKNPGLIKILVPVLTMEYPTKTQKSI